MTAPRLPPLNALRVFHVVARHLNFRSAAEELLVSPQAVSQQVRQLEEHLGVTLFARLGRGVALTDEGVLLSHFVAAGFDAFLEGLRRVTRGPARDRVDVNVSPYFATRYLLDRLGAFRARAPGIDLRLTTTVELPDFAADEIDVSIQWGYGTWTGLDLTRLVDDPKVLCCAPALGRRLNRPADLAGKTLLHSAASDRLWPDVLRHLGVSGVSVEKGMQFHDAAMMRRATVAGMGVGLLSRHDAAEDITAGLLVAPFGAESLAGMPAAEVPGFYLVLPRARRRVAAVAAFCDWVAGEDWTRPPDEAPGKAAAQ